MNKVSNLAIIYKIILKYKNEKYIYIGSTLDLNSTREEIFRSLDKGNHSNYRLQKVYDLIKDIGEVEYIKIDVLQALRKCYYQNNILPIVLEQLEKSFVTTIKEDYKNKNKEYLVLN